MSAGRWIAAVRPTDHSRAIELAGDAEEITLCKEEDATLLLSGAVEGRSAEELLTSYRQSAASFLPSLRGRFALLIVDHRSSSVLLARDPMGVHPVFFAQDGPHLAIGPTPEIVARREGRTPELDRVAAAAFLARIQLPGQITLFEHVRRLLQGHLVELRDRVLTVRRYWWPAEHSGETSDDFEILARRAVERSHGRLGVFLSGGIDSAVVACLAAEVAKARGDAPPVALSLTFPGSPTDESDRQRRVAERLGLEHVLASPRELLGPQPLLVAAVELARASQLSHPPELLAPAYMKLASAGAELGCEVLLDGSGGDESLMPPRGYAADSLWRFDVGAVRDLIRATRDYWPDERILGPQRSVFLDSGVLPLTRSVLGTLATRLAPTRYSSLRTSRGAARVPLFVASDPGLRRRLVAALVSATPPVPPGHHAAYERRHVLDSPGVSTALERNWDVDTRLAVRSASPLLDPDVVSYLCGFDPRRLVEHGRAKAPGRPVLARVLGELGDPWPRTVYGNAFWIHMIRREGPSAWSSIGGLPRLAAAGVVDEASVRRILCNEADLRPLSDLSAAWRALTLEAWLTDAKPPILTAEP